MTSFLFHPFVVESTRLAIRGFAILLVLSVFANVSQAGLLDNILDILRGGNNGGGSNGGGGGGGVPEMDPGSLVSAMSLLSGSLLMLASRRKRA
jgi:hypothetical protein